MNCTYIIVTDISTVKGIFIKGNFSFIVLPVLMNTPVL